MLSPPPFVVRTLRRLSVTRRGALFLLCGLVFVFATFGGLSVLSVSKSTQRVTDWTLRSAHVAAQRLGDRLQHEQDSVELLARWPGIASSIELLQSGRPGIAPPWVTLHYLASDPHDFADCVFVTGADGTVMWTKPPGLGLLNRNLSSYPEIRSVFARGETYTSNVIRDGFWPEPHILIATPIRNDKQELIGIVGNIIGAGKLRHGDLFGEVQGLTEEVTQGETYLVDEAGVIVTATNPNLVFTRVGDEALLSRIRRQEVSIATLGSGNVQAVQPIAPVRWSLILERSAKEVYRDIYQLERNLVIVGLLLTLLAILVWVPFISSFVDPIRSLTREAERIASGDLSHSIHGEGRDEIAVLSNSLDHMRQQLQTQQKMLETQIRELRTTNRLKSEFIANLSHEFRTPVHIMRGYMDLILEGVFGQVPEALREPLATVSKQYTSLWALLESCLDLAKIDAGEVYADIETFDLCDLVREVMDDFRPQLRETGLRGLVSVPDHCRLATGNGFPGCHVQSDRSKVQRVLRNLLSNAVKFTSAGEIEVRVEDGPRSDAFTLRVRDTGIGIRAEDQQIIFERFRQADGSTTRRHGGVGLGLHIAHELVRFLGGTISVASTPGAGTTFSIVLPRAFVGAEDAAASLFPRHRSTTEPTDTAGLFGGHISSGSA